MASPVGQSVLRVEDGPLLRGEAGFLDDVKQAGVLHVALLRSPLAHARIESVDLEAARRAPGVSAAFRNADMRGTCAPFRVHVTTPGAIAPERWPLAADRVRYVGEVVAAVVAGSRYQAEDALELVKLDLEPLKVISTVDDAMAPGAPLVHASVPGNLYFHGHRSFGDVDGAFRAADVVVEGEVVHPRVSAAPMEGRGVIAKPDGTGGVVVWSSTQAPNIVAEAIAEDCGLELTAVRVITPDVGGGFGAKAHAYTEEVLLAWIAMRMNAPVKWVEDRSEHLQSSSHARDQRIRFSAAVRKDGRVLGIRATVASNIGAYGIRPHGPLLDPMTTAGLITGPYDIRNYEYDSYAVATNRVPMGPYRGVGMVTAVLVHERIMNMVATRLNLDPADVRRINFITSEQMPYTTVTGHPYESGDHAAAQKLALDAFDYKGAVAEQKTARATGRLVGIGLSSYVEFTGAGSSTFKSRGMVGISGIDTARAWVDANGVVQVQTSCPAIGQGVQTTIAQVVAGAMGIDIALVRVEQTDTGKVRTGTGSFQSRSSVTAATSADRAGKQLRETILNAASWKLDQPVERLGFLGPEIAVDGHATGVTLADLANSNPDSNGGYTLDVEVSYDPVQASHPYATHACTVEIDQGTGAVTILRYMVADDCGRVINPMIVEGQVHGGIAQGLGAVLFEEIAYDAEAQMLSGSFMDYLLPTSMEMPSIDVKHMVTPAPMHELGTKGVGEAGTIGSTAAVANAIADALGVSDCILPYTPDRIMSLIGRQAAG